MLDAFPFDNLATTEVRIERHLAPQKPKNLAVLVYSNHAINPSLASKLARWDQAFSAVRALGLLHENWDGYNALRVRSAVVDNVVRALEMMSTSNSAIPVPEATPTSSGTISLAWDNSNLDAVLEFGLTRYSGYIQGRHDPIVYLEGSATDFGFEDRAVLAAAINADLSRGAISNVSGNSFLATSRLAA